MTWGLNTSNGMASELPSHHTLLHCPVYQSCHRDPKLVVDSEGRIIAILLGQPDDPDWANVVKEAARALRRACRSAMRAGIWCPGSSHRRGTYYSITSGVSFGGGQKVGTSPCFAICCSWIYAAAWKPTQFTPDMPNPVPAPSQ
jgi:hypothetical protein